MAIYAELQRVLGEHFTRNQHDIRWCFPTTTTWDESGTRALRAAIVGAGFVGTISDHRLTLLPELEASAHFCGESRWGEVQAGAAIIVAECGGGTVDLAAFIVESQDPFRVKQLTSPTGDSCGYVICISSLMVLILTSRQIRSCEPQLQQHHPSKAQENSIARGLQNLGPNVRQVNHRV